MKMGENAKITTACEALLGLLCSVIARALTFKFNIMLSTTTVYGEFINTTIEQGIDNKFNVNKFVDGVLRSSYPTNSHGQAKMLALSLIK